MKKTWWIAAALLVVAAAVAAWFLLAGNKNGSTTYRTAKVERGDVVQTVRATGVVQPLQLVQVGTQVNGPVRKLYVDFNSVVKEGDLVAQIDPIVYEARLAQDEANLNQAQATVEQTQVRLAEAEKELERAKKLAGREMLSQADLDTAAANRDSLAAQLTLGKAGVEQAKAALRLSRANLSYTTIRSPMAGVVISRNVSEGQTVVASMSAQVLFQIASDLSTIQVEASIPEADIGKIKEGQPVSFTVDAFDTTFTGRVASVRMSAATVQNVVTYPVIIQAENPKGRLFPGMTATIVCETARRDGVLRVPNAALRFRPESETKPDAAQRNAGGGGGQGGRRGARSSKVYVQDKPGNPPTNVIVVAGISDGTVTELRDAGSLEEGSEVITGQNATAAGKADVVNPFAPPTPPGMRRAGGR
jgi:HlyD family secretion protein